VSSVFYAKSSGRPEISAKLWWMLGQFDVEITGFG
jgi:hypothetical protein